MNVYAVHHKDDCAEECMPILARTWQQARSIGARELYESYSDMRTRRLQPPTKCAVTILAEPTARVLTDDEARLFGWVFEEDEEP